MVKEVLPLKIGSWEERPDHFGDVWHYWTDDRLGHFEFFQLAMDLRATPVWVFTIGTLQYVISILQELMDVLEFARGNAKLKWGTGRASMRHTEPFDLKYVATGNEDCGKINYHGYCGAFQMDSKRGIIERYGKEAFQFSSKCVGTWKQELLLVLNKKF